MLEALLEMLIYSILDHNSNNEENLKYASNLYPIIICY